MHCSYPHLPGNIVINIGGTDFNVHVIGRLDCAFGATFTVSAVIVFAPVHLPIFFQRFVEPFVLNQLSLAFGDFVSHYQAVIVKYFYAAVLYAQDCRLSDQGMRNNIAVAFKTDCTVLADLSIYPGKRYQMY